jgi:hypothetical protein
MFRIIAECRNNKTNLFCCFVDFRKAFDIVPKTNLWNMLEEPKVPSRLSAATVSCMGTLLSSLGALRVGQNKLIAI